MNGGMSCHSMGADTMMGLPDWAFYGALLAAVVMTLWAVYRSPRWFRSGGEGYRRWEVSAWPPLRWLLSRRWFQFSLQLPLVLLLGLILYAGFYGTPVSEKNFATIATWTLWWALLVVDIVLLGRMWCLVCPWDALASWIRRLAFWRRRSAEPLALDLPWPGWLKNVYPATVLFVGLTWLELGFGVTRSPRATAILGLAMVLLAVLPALIFERRAFCKYGCLVGRICGLYSMLAPVEVRPRSLATCHGCRTHDCLEGNERGYPCPTGQFLPSMRANTYCTVCTECFKSCPHDNVALNVRPWGADLVVQRRPRRDEAMLALVMLSLTSFHGLTMTPAWYEVIAWVRGVSGWRFLPAFSAGMLVILVVPAALFLLFAALQVRMGVARPVGADVSRPTLAGVAMRYAYPLIAIALTYHLAHNLGHLITEAGALLPVISDPLGSGLDLFGTRDLRPGALAPQTVVWTLQIALVLLGLWWALRAAERARRAIAAQWAGAGGSLGARLVPALFLLLVTAANLWLLAQPMEMRTGM